MMKTPHILLFLFLTVATTAADGPYNDAANAKADIKQALAQAMTNHTDVIVVLGANWCPDCMALESAMEKGSSAALLARDFQIVRVSVGHLDKNLDIAKSYGISVEKGVPDVVIISADNKVLYVTKAGEVANARYMGEDGIYKFFKQVTASVKTGK
jgi:thioredoxin 1